MRCLLLFTAIYVFSALIAAVPFPHSVTKVIIETRSVIDGQVTDSVVASITPPPTGTSLTNPAAASLASLLAGLEAPSSIIAKLPNVPASVLSIFESPNAFVEYWLIVNDQLPPVDASWINALSTYEWNWINSQADRYRTDADLINSLFNMGISEAMVTISASASLLNQTVVATLQGFGKQFITTAYPAPSDIPPPASTGMPMPELVGLSMGIPAGIWLAVTLIALFYCGGIESCKRDIERLRLEKVARQAAGLRLGTQAGDSQNPVLPFPGYNTRGFATQTTFVQDGGHDAMELVEMWVASTGDSLKDSPFSTEADEPIDKPSACNSVCGMDTPQAIKRKPVGSVSSRRVVSMDGVPTSEQVGTTTGVVDDDSKKEHKDFVDALEMSAAPVVGHMQQESSDGREEGANANLVEDGQKNRDPTQIQA